MELDGQLIFFSIVLGLALLISVIVFVAFRHERSVLDEWGRFALQRGLDFKRPGDRSEEPRVGGRIGNRDFTMTRTTISSADTESNTLRVTRIDLTVPDLPRGLVAYERPTGRVVKGLETLALSIAERLSGPLPDEVETGDPAIDEKWVIRGFDEEAVRAWTSSTTRREALFEVSATEGLRVVDGGIRWQGTTPRKCEKIEAIVHQLEHYADRFEAV